MQCVALCCCRPQGEPAVLTFPMPQDLTLGRWTLFRWAKPNCASAEQCRSLRSAPRFRTYSPCYLDAADAPVHPSQKVWPHRGDQGQNTQCLLQLEAHNCCGWVAVEKIHMPIPDWHLSLSGGSWCLQRGMLKLQTCCSPEEMESLLWGVWIHQHPQGRQGRHSLSTSELWAIFWTHQGH